jgi:hypothetical protein
MIRYAGHVARMGREEVYVRILGFWLENLKEGEYLEDRSVDGKIILRWIFRN